MTVPQWYFIPPPYDMDKPISLSAPPMGAVRTDSASPYDTIQVIGRSRMVTVPESISMDMGVTDAFVTEYGQRITFKGKGKETNVGTRIPETTKGMSIPSVEEYIEASDLVSSAPVSIQGISRSTMSKKKPIRKKRRVNDFSDLTSLQGIRW